MDKNEYELIKEAYLKLEDLAKTKGVLAIKRAAFVHPGRWSRYVAAHPSFEHFDFDSDEVVYSRSTIGEVDTERIPVGFLWSSSVDDEAIEQKRRDEEEEQAMKRAWKEEEERRKAEQKSKDEQAELLLYKRLKRKYERNK